MRRNKNILVFVAALVILLAIVPFTRKKISVSFSYVFSPMIGAISHSSFATRGLFHGISEISDLKKINAELTNKLSQAEIDKNELNELKIENETLKKQLGFVEAHQNRELIPAKIIGRDPISALDYIVIDKGSDDGVGLGLAIITDGALVGKVSEVNAKSSKVMLITSKDSIVQAMLQDSREVGILTGGLAGLSLDNIPQDIATNKGEMVITSGLGGDLEQGLMIGSVYGATSGSADIFKTLSVQPIVDFSKLEIVFVYK
ncbi:MAG: rod shape-determining protein MreC [Patescibacteria group bacterium]|jgi:rod shape-determining protein MreC